METHGGQAPVKREVVDFLIAEYQWASGLLPFYRQVELTAVGVAALLLSAVASVVAVLEGGDKDRAAEAALLSAAAWGPALLLMLELMALARIQRAAIYIRDYIAKPVRDLTGEASLLQWEYLPARQLFFKDRNVPRWRRAMIAITVSSAPVVVAIWSMTVALAVAGAVVHPVSPGASVLFIGYGAAAVATCLCAYGIHFTYTHELRPAAKSG